MLSDSHYLTSDYVLPEQEHKYGKQVHLVKDPYLTSLLARFSQPACVQPLTNQILKMLYEGLVQHLINGEFETGPQEITTRMSSLHPEARFNQRVVLPDLKVVTVGLARAGTLPSQTVFDMLNQLLRSEGVRQDHIAINRKVDSTEKVVGTDLAGFKIGGDIKDSYVLFPDPMGATGSTLKTATEIYQKQVKGPARKFVALHLIVTPEYLLNIKNACPDLIVYALRLDRGLSPKDVLQTVPGTHWQKEKGLNEKQYIVPGAGGVGELINNSYV